MNNLSRLLMSSALCAVCTMANAQQVNVSGVIKDATGETVIGASVMVKGTKTGTVTDFDGRFHVECTPGATLRALQKQQNNCILPSQRYPDKWRHLKRSLE